MLEDTAKRVFSYGPAFLRLVWRILTHPVSEVALRAQKRTFATDACALWAISAVIFFTTRFIAWNAEVSETLFFVARMFSETVILFGTTLGFFWGGKILRGAAEPAQVLTATAYIWGALMPLQAIFGLIMFGMVERVDPSAFVTLVNIANGCTGVMEGLADIETAFDRSAQADPLRFLGAFAPIAVQYVALTAIYAVYGIAYLRVLKRLTGLSALRFAAAAIVGGFLAVTLAWTGETFAFVLWQRNAPCLELGGV